MTFMYDYPGWSVETTHDIALDTPCADAVEPTIKMAGDWGSVAHQHQFTDENGDVHTIVVRQVPEEPPRRAVRGSRAQARDRRKDTG